MKVISSFLPLTKTTFCFRGISSCFVGAEFLLEESISFGLHKRTFFCFSCYGNWQFKWARCRSQCRQCGQFSCDILATGWLWRQTAAYSFSVSRRGEEVFLKALLHKIQQIQQPTNQSTHPITLKIGYVQNGFWTRDKCVLSFSRDHAVNPESVHSMFLSFGSLFSYLPSARKFLPFLTYVFSYKQVQVTTVAFL